MPNPETVEQADIELGQTLASKKEHPWVRALVTIGELGDQGPLYATSGTVILVGLLTWNARRARIGVSMLLAVAAAEAAKTLVKRTVKRTRPHVLLEEGHYESETGGSEDKDEQSFPSGHTACTVALGRALTRLNPSAGPWMTGAAVIVSSARLAKGAHWPLDVAAGVVIGWIAELLSSQVLRGAGVDQRPPDPTRE